MIRSRHFRNGFSFLLGLSSAITVGVATPSPAQALPWGNLIFRGIQLFQLSHLSTQQKVELGDQIHQQVLQNHKLNSDPQLNAYINRVGQRLASASSCSALPFHFYVIQDNAINAFSTTGGYVYVNSGLINATDNEAQLAGVLAHEIGHICNNDLINQLQRSTLAQGAAAATGLDQSTVAGLAYQVAVALPHSRQAEFAADTAGLSYMERAGYDPYALPNFLSKLLQYPSGPAFLSDHPATRDRITALEEKIASQR
jgi:predicted Zn-dependent protease